MTLESDQELEIDAISDSAAPTPKRHVPYYERATHQRPAPARTQNSARIRTPWKALKITSRLLLYVGLSLYLWGTYWLPKFPNPLAMRPELLAQPQQEEVAVQPFPFDYAGKSYTIEPIAHYDISGLIVSHNNISSITDAYHTSESVDFKDICLVWGSNVTSGFFRQAKFWSGPWTCHLDSKDPSTWTKYNPTALSNNHLLSADPKVRALIDQMRVGDQVRLRGYLIDYYPRAQPEHSRKSSLVRDDEGDGACEVLWVEQAAILSRGATTWRSATRVGWWMMLAALLISAVLFLIAPLRLYIKRS